jgi:uncharacterized protein (TIGR03437 family)
MFRKSLVLILAGTALAAGAMAAGAFGTVVAIGGAASDVALDEARGVAYIANFTANRVEILSTATNTIQTSINVAAQPSSLSLSPDGHWLLVAHYGNNTAPASQQNGLTLIDLTNNNSKQTFTLGSAPLGVGFGIDNRALVVTTTEFIIFDPAVGSTTTLTTIQAAAKQALPAPAQSFPPSITGASVAVSADYTTIYGLGDNLEFRYDVAHRALIAYNYISTPPQGPRAVSVSADGSFVASGWTLSDFYLNDIGEFPAPSGILNVGGHAIDSTHNVVYSQVTQKQGEAPTLTVRDLDNLTIRETLLLPENLAGKTAVSHDGSVIYATSDSGLLVLPIGNLNKAPRLVTSTQQLLFLGNFCDRTLASQTFTVTSPSGGKVPFQISASYTGVTVTPSSGTTPAVVTVTVDPAVFQNQKGTATVQLKVTSATAINSVPPINIQINSKEPDQRGTIVMVPGVLVDLVADPIRNRFYILRSDQNQVLVFDGSNNLQIGTLRTCTAPTSMAISTDGATLYVGCNYAHIMSVYSLDTLQALPYINTGNGYVQSVAASNKAILAVMRDGGGGTPYIARIDPVTRTTSRPLSLGVYENKVLLTSVLTSSPNGSDILMASSDGAMLLYDANVDSFTISRKDPAGALSGAYAASSFSQYVVGHTLYNASLVPVVQFESSTGNPSGFVFVDNVGVRTTAPNLNSPGVIQRADLASGAGIRPTSVIEAPLLGLPPSAQINTCNTVTNGNTTTETCTVGSTVTTTVCLISNNAFGVPTQTCTSLTTTVNPQPGFSRTLALLQNRTSFISLSASGFTVLPVTYDASVAVPKVTAVVSAADGKSPAAPGGLISLFGTNLSPTNLATREIPVPTALGNSCLTVNGQPLPLIFVSPGQINAQMPFQAVGNVTMIVHTPGGVSDNFNMTVLSNAPAVFLSGAAGPVTNLPTIVRAENNQLATDSNPVHHGDTLVIYLTGMGGVTPVVANGMPAPANPLATALVTPTVQLGGVSLPVYYAGLAPGQVGVYQINVSVPGGVPQGLSVPLNITQGGFSNSFSLRVVD